MASFACTKGFSTPLPQDAAVNTLTASEKDIFCQEYADFSKDFELTYAANYCNMVIVNSAIRANSANEAKDTCEDLATTCATAIEEKFESDSPYKDKTFDNCTERDFESCEATVAEIQACINETYTFFDGIYEEYSGTCSELIDSADELSEVSEPDRPACEVVQEKCPTSRLISFKPRFQ